MKIQYIEKNFSDKVEAAIAQSNRIIKEYADQGYSLTLRQLYYQFVARGILENSERSYKNLGSWISNARLAGLIDWDAIEDRTRKVIQSSHWQDPGEIIASCAKQFKLDKWENQDQMVEVWIEKEALTGVFRRVCRELDIPLYACRGYNSQSEMWRGAQRVKSYYEDRCQMVTILYFGDHDPSGLDMDRDLRDRFRTFDAECVLERAALTEAQIGVYEPPPNPTKVSDSRAPKYFEEYGSESWELDALEPQVLSDLVRDHVVSLRDQELWDVSVAREREYKKTLRKLSKTWEDKR